MTKKERYYLTVFEFNRFIKQSFYRTKYAAPKSEEVEEIVGISRGEFIDHLEATFRKRYGITTEKYLQYFPYRNLYIDHIKPLRFARSREEVKALCHYSNLQLLLARDNAAKEKGIDISVNHADPAGFIAMIEKVGGIDNAEKLRNVRESD